MAGHSYQRRFPGRFTYINPLVKYSLCLANFLFLVTGGFLLVLGVIAFIESGGMPKSDVNVLQWIFNLTVICIVVGIITSVLSMMGFVGSLREYQCCLKVYYSILAIVLLIEIICCVLFFVYRETAVKQLEDLIRKTFVTQYREMGFEDTTNFVDFVQKELNCCGPKTYMDWNFNRYFACNSTIKSPESCGVPYSCCRRMNNINANVINTSCGFGVQRMPALASRLVWTTGCVHALLSLLEANIIAVACTGSGIAVLQLIAILLAKALYTQIGDQLRLLRQEQNMPLFQRKFSVPKFPPRKAASMTNLSQLDPTRRSEEFGLDLGPIRTRLSGRDLVFRDGSWVIENVPPVQESPKQGREAFRAKKENHLLAEENNLLKLKIEILLDMLAETSAEVHLQENEIENLRSVLNKRSPVNAIQVS